MLQSLRADTRQASPEKVAKLAKVKLSKMHVGFLNIGGQKKFRVLSAPRTEFKPQGNQAIVMECATRPLWENKVFEFVDDQRSEENKKMSYYIVAPTPNAALKWAQAKLYKRADKHAGLAKVALGILMAKTSTRQKPTDKINDMTGTIAKSATRVTMTKAGDNFNLCLEDLLDYSARALKSGDAAIQNAMMKAANKQVGLLNHRCKNLLSFQPLDTPFPEVSSRRRRA
jgi:hypothetical protein